MGMMRQPSKQIPTPSATVSQTSVPDKVPWELRGRSCGLQVDARILGNFMAEYEATET